MFLFKFDTSKADGQFKKTASCKKLRNVYPQFEFTSLAKGYYFSVSLNV